MQRSNHCTDKILVSMYRRGNQEAFELLFSRHKDKVYTSIYWYVNDVKLANIIFEETFKEVIDKVQSDNYNSDDIFLKLLLLTAYSIIKTKKIKQES